MPKASPADNLAASLAVQGRRGFLLRNLGSIRRLTLLIVLVGLIWRIGRFALGFPIWGDEAFVAGSLLVRDFQTLITPPMEYKQIAPLGFMWAELAASRLLGLNEWSLRLVATLCGIGGFVLFWRFARRVLDARSALLAIAIMAASYYVVRHGAELKPYAGDMLVSLALTALGWAVSRRPNSWGLWASLTAVGGVGVWLSYPSVFVLAGVGVFLLRTWIKTWHGRERPCVAGHLALAEDCQTRGETPLGRMGKMPMPHSMLAGLAIVSVFSAGSFLAVYTLYTGPQARHPANAHYFGRQDEGDDDAPSTRPAKAKKVTQWDAGFPPFDRPAKLPLWLLDVHTGNLLAYPFGGNHFASTGTTILVIAGIGTLWRKGRRDLLLLLLTPLGAAFLAACMRKYPYGVSARTMLFMAPAFCLLAGAGLHALVRWLAPPRRRSMIVRAAATVLAIVVVAFLASNIARPYKSPCYKQTRDAVRAVAAQTAPGDRWVVANYRRDALREAQWDLGVPFLGGHGAPTFRYCAQTLAPTDVQWGPRIGQARIGKGKTFVLCYSDPGYDIPTDLGLVARKMAALVADAAMRPVFPFAGQSLGICNTHGRKEWHEAVVADLAHRLGPPTHQTITIGREDMDGTDTLLDVYVFPPPKQASLVRSEAAPSGKP